MNRLYTAAASIRAEKSEGMAAMEARKPRYHLRAISAVPQHHEEDAQV